MISPDEAMIEQILQGLDRGSGCASCEDVLNYLFELLDNELRAEDCAWLQQHLQECQCCQDCAQLEKDIRQILKRCCQESAPTNLRTRIVAQISMWRAE